MKFLTKYNDSDIIKENLKYKKGNNKNNRILKEKLLKEQNNFCAYTEKYIEGLDSVEVEHFNSDIKYNDYYYNYYAVIREVNKEKAKKDKSKKYKNAKFFETLFFQNKDEFNKRIRYDKASKSYYELDENDDEAKQLIDYLGFNDEITSIQRKNAISRLKEIFEKGKWSQKEITHYFSKYKDELSFITAIEAEFEINLEKFL